MEIWTTSHATTNTLCSITINVEEADKPLVNRLGRDGTYSYVFHNLDRLDIKELIMSLQNRLETME